MFRTLYRGATTLAGPLVPLLLNRRTARGKEDPARRGERLGIAGRPRPGGRLVWIHGASVGEALSVLSLIDRLLQTAPDLHVLLTTHTVTAARLLESRLPDRAFHQYIPLDRISYVDRFLDHWRPDLAIWLESELWPNLLDGIAKRSVPAVMLNARMSGRSAARWARAQGTLQAMMAVFQAVLPASKAEAEKLTSLGIRQLGPAGNIKYAAPPPPADTDAVEALANAVGDRPVWLAASTHEGEEEICFAAQRRLLADRPDLLLVLAPRHPPRGPEIAQMIEAAGWQAGRRSEGALPAPGDPIYLADTLGEMGVLLRLAPIAFVGGSLVPVGGHNPIEPAQLDAAVLTGRQVENFSDVMADMAAAGGLAWVDGADDLAAKVDHLLSDPSARTTMTQSARTVAEQNSGMLDTVMATLSPLLVKAPP
ncbi:MAG: 3-deoxy-D-manno-octulosonic acid transferase [Pseudomonadota bacterium]